MMRLAYVLQNIVILLEDLSILVCLSNFCWVYAKGGNEIKWLLWPQTVRQLHAICRKEFVECGSGEVLTGQAGRIVKG